MASVFFYISGHGFGHASREIEVINALGALDTGTDIVVRTSTSSWLFDRTVRAPFTLIDGRVDTGVVQIDSLRLDEPATIRRASEFYAALPQAVENEVALLRECAAQMVISDAPPLGCAAAAAAGIPSVVCSNFTWDWIYEGYDAPADLILRIQEAYRKADAAWRLPMHGGFDTFARIVDVPFIARHARRSRDDVRAMLALPLDRPLALSSFGAYGVRNFDPATLDCLDSIGVVITEHETTAERLPRGVTAIDVAHIYESGLTYEDLVAAVDVVVTKPGYGIIAECIANDTAMLYTSRGHFVEYDVLVREMPRYLRCRFLPLEDLLAGRWREGLEHVLDQPAPPERPRTDGADVVAGMIQEIAGLTSRVT